jgi:hypothetical protein
VADRLGGLVTLNALLWMGGASLLLLTGHARGLGSLRRWVGLSYLVGVAYFGVVAQVLLVLGAALDRVEIVAVTLLPVLVALLRGSLKAREPAVELRSWKAAAVFLPAAPVLLSNLAAASAQPLRGWDAWSFWTPKAESIVHFGGLSSAYFHSGVGNADYPMLIPALETAAFRFMGSMDTVLVHVQFSLLFAAFVLTLGELLSGHVGGVKVACYLLIVAAAGGLYTQTLDAYADVPLAVFAAAAALVGWLWVGSGRQSLLLVMTILVSGALSTKMEARILVPALLAAFAIVRFRSRQSVRPLLGAAAAAVLVAVAPWQAWVSAHHIEPLYHFQLSHVTGDPGRFPQSLGQLAADFLSIREWQFLPVVVIAALVAGLFDPRLRGKVVATCGGLVLSIVALAVTYWGTSEPFPWQLDVSSSRVITGPLLIAAAVGGLCLDARIGSADKQRSSP